MTEKLNKLLSQQKKLQKKIEQKETTLRQSNYYENAKKRKERTRLLIQKGALLDKYFGTNNLSIVETEKLLKMFSSYVNAHKPNNYY